MVINALSELLETGALRPIDYSFGTFMAGQARCHSESVAVICAFISQALGQQHSCVHLDSLLQQIPETLGKITPSELIQYLREAHLLTDSRVNDGQADAPLVLDDNRLYLQRYWHYESLLAQHIIRLARHRLPLNETLAKEVLSQLFEHTEPDQINWQCVAVSVAAQCRFSMITGGPGTGKTTTVTRLLALIQALAEAENRPLKIKMVAPTGKAAARLTESIVSSKQLLPVKLQSHLPTECSTIHRLLGALPGRPQFRHSERNPLHLDLLVVDEASMVDLPLMAKLFSALPEHGRVILLGDQDQLASVETGSVLTDLCSAAQMTSGLQGFSEPMARSIARLAGYELPVNDRPSQVSDNWVRLHKSHRFNADSGIAQLASLFNCGETTQSIRLLAEGREDLVWEQKKRFRKLADSLRPGAKAFFDAVAAGDVEAAFSKLQHQQVLCAHRSGEWGIDNLNQILEGEWQAQGWINAEKEYYVGRPIMLTENDHQQRLYNGDIGIVFPAEAGSELNKVFFPDAHGHYRAVLPSRLPPHETLYAMTIHKSQGSEFNDVYMCLPDMPSSGQLKGLNRALLYTGLTRARQRFILYASQGVIAESLRHVSKRTSGLAERLGTKPSEI